MANKGSIHNEATFFQYYFSKKKILSGFRKTQQGKKLYLENPINHLRQLQTWRCKTILPGFHLPILILASTKLTLMVRNLTYMQLKMLQETMSGYQLPRQLSSQGMRLENQISQILYQVDFHSRYKMSLLQSSITNVDWTYKSCRKKQIKLLNIFITLVR